MSPKHAENQNVDIHASCQAVHARLFMPGRSCQVHTTVSGVSQYKTFGDTVQ